MQYVRLALAETLYGRFALRDWHETAKLVPACLVMDCRGVYDALMKSESSCLGMKDKRSGLEALALKRSMMATNTSLRWCHSEAQIADCLTKGSEQAQRPFELLKQRGFRWKLVYDPDFIAAKKRTKEGLNILDDPNDLLQYLDERDEETNDLQDIADDSDQKNPELLQAMRMLGAPSELEAQQLT